MAGGDARGRALEPGRGRLPGDGLGVRARAGVPRAEAPGDSGHRLGHRVGAHGVRGPISASVAIGADLTSPEDEHGHGTFVASIARRASSRYPGVAPTAHIVSLRVMDAGGASTVSDVIAAADWVLANKDTYGIRVANFSLHAASPSSFKFDPLAHAVERLWFNGVVVVAASGNFVDGTPAGHVLRARQRPVRDHGRSGRRERDPGHRGRRHRAVVGVRLHGGRLRQAGAVGTRPLHDRRRTGVVDARHRSRRQGGRAGLHAAFRDILRGPRGRRRGRAAASAPPRLDAGRGEGRPHADRPPARGDARWRRRRRRSRRRGGRGSRGSADANAALDPYVVSADGAGGLAFDAAAWSSAAWSSAAWSSAAWSSAAWSSSAEADAALADAAWSSAAWSY